MMLRERIHDRLLHSYSNLVMPSGQPGGRVLIPCNVGYGDLVFLLPVLRALDGKDTTLVLDDTDKADFLRQVGIQNAWIFPWERLHATEYDTIICTHAQQWTPIIYQVIDKRIPCRIGHIWREKYSWAWTHKVPFVDGWHERTNNASLLEPFKLKPIHRKIEIEPERGFDVLIAPNTTSPEKDWDGYDELARKIFATPNTFSFTTIYEKLPMNKLLRAIAGARLIIGNDSGLPKIADAMGIPAIQIFKACGWQPSRSGLSHGIDLVEPTVDEVFTRAQIILQEKQ
jgi:ADP-heptose:LPS heptosyltransferase